MLAAATLPAAMARMDGGGAGDAVTAREHSLHVRQMGAAVRQDRTAPLDLNTGLLEAVGLNALADGHDDDIRRDPELWLIRAVGTGAAVFCPPAQ